MAERKGGREEATSFPGSLFFPPGKKRDPGNEVGGRLGRRRKICSLSPLNYVSEVVFVGRNACRL